MLIRLRGCTGWSAPLLFAYGIRYVFAWRGPYYMHISWAIMGMNIRFYINYTYQDQQRAGSQLVLTDMKFKKFHILQIYLFMHRQNWCHSNTNRQGGRKGFSQACFSSPCSSYKQFFKCNISLETEFLLKYDRLFIYRLQLFIYFL